MSSGRPWGAAWAPVSAGRVAKRRGWSQGTADLWGQWSSWAGVKGRTLSPATHRRAPLSRHSNLLYSHHQYLHFPKQGTMYWHQKESNLSENLTEHDFGFWAGFQRCIVQLPCKYQNLAFIQPQQGLKERQTLALSFVQESLQERQSPRLRFRTGDGR